MSTDDVVCTGWLIKSPPEKKLKRFECEVTIEAEVRPTKRQYQNQHLFVVKTATRIFYLLAKTAEEMNIWVQNIGQICTFGGLNRHAGEFDNAGRNWNKRLSLNLPIFLNTTVTENHSEDSYVPMASPPISCSDVTSDGYIPMSPSTLPISLLTNGKTELPTPSNPDLEPPPVDRNLKPRTRARPPPLDLRGLSTISECPFHGPLTRTMTEPSTSLQSVPLDRRRVWGLNGSEQEGSITPTESRLLFPACDSVPWMRPSQLDYLSLDFNSSSPSPVQKKALLADEYRVDYVKVDEKKTQALQNTKLEWKDVRQSKA
ncbi:hypothetical protein cypCar_00012794 [Cyprinus carpio]|nr:hypothetical protein cypCar_00012794 [Cyprinus carpio]